MTAGRTFRSKPGTAIFLVTAIGATAAAVGTLLDPGFRSDGLGVLLILLTAGSAAWLWMAACVPPILITDSDLVLWTGWGRKSYPWEGVAAARVDNWSAGGRNTIVFELRNGRRRRPAALVTLSGNRQILNEIVELAETHIAKHSSGI